MRQQPFQAVVERHGDAVLRVCRALAGPDHAEDIWSDTFLAALRAYRDLPRGSNVEAWLVTIARRKVIDHWRAESRRPTAVSEVPERADGRAIPGGWESDLWEALRGLTERQREAVAFHYLGGLPYAEIATITGGTAEAARRAASDGIAALRRAYTEGDSK